MMDYTIARRPWTTDRMAAATDEHHRKVSALEDARRQYNELRGRILGMDGLTVDPAEAEATASRAFSARLVMLQLEADTARSCAETIEALEPLIDAEAEKARKAFEKEIEKAKRKLEKAGFVGSPQMQRMAEANPEARDRQLIFAAKQTDPVKFAHLDLEAITAGRNGLKEQRSRAFQRIEAIRAEADGLLNKHVRNMI
jgi:hypothetical protein